MLSLFGMDKANYISFKLLTPHIPFSLSLSYLSDKTQQLPYTVEEITMKRLRRSSSYATSLWRMDSFLMMIHYAYDICFKRFSKPTSSKSSKWVVLGSNYSKGEDLKSLAWLMILPTALFYTNPSLSPQPYPRFLHGLTPHRNSVKSYPIQSKFAPKVPRKRPNLHRRQSHWRTHVRMGIVIYAYNKKQFYDSTNHVPRVIW